MQDEELVIGEAADWRLNEISRNLNVAFSALVIVMVAFIGISLYYNINIWECENRSCSN
jgi:hypothetical protein